MCSWRCYEPSRSASLAEIESFVKRDLIHAFNPGPSDQVKICGAPALIEGIAGDRRYICDDSRPCGGGMRAVEAADARAARANGVHDELRGLPQSESESGGQPGTGDRGIVAGVGRGSGARSQ